MGPRTERGEEGKKRGIYTLLNTLYSSDATSFQLCNVLSGDAVFLKRVYVDEEGF